MKVEKFDHVHDIQKIYRDVLDSMSKPGRVNKIGKELEKIDTYTNIPKGIMGMAYLLLNTESTFYIQSKEMQSYIKLHTYGVPVEADEAGYIFIDSKEIGEKHICRIIENSRRGDLLDPHKGATVVVRVDVLSEGSKYRITGPGVKGYHETCLGGLSKEFLQSRDAANAEYPMGVDIILLDKAGRVMALPRTTKVEVID